MTSQAKLRFRRVRAAYESAGHDAVVRGMAKTPVGASAVVGETLEVALTTINEGLELRRHGADVANASKAPKNQERWRQWQQAVDDIRRVNPTLSNEQVYKRVAARFKVTPRAVRNRCT